MFDVVRPVSSWSIVFPPSFPRYDHYTLQDRGTTDLY